MCDPNDLAHLDMIWGIVLESETEAVAAPAIHLLVYSYIAVDASNTPEEQRRAYLQALLDRCFDLIKPENNPSPLVVGRATRIINEVIQQSERNGTGGVRPHRAILKGELYDRILVKYINAKNMWGEEKVERAIVVKLYTSCTLWEFKSEVARLLGLGPKYLEFEFPGNRTLEDKQHGMDML